MIKIPDKKNIHRTEAADPLDAYYFPVAKSFFLKRLEMVVSIIQDRFFDRLVDMGCGSGIFLKELETKCGELHAIDNHGKMKLVRKMVEAEHIKANLCEGSIVNLPYGSEVFDCVISMSVLEHIKNLGKAFDEIDRVTKNNGMIILGFPVKNIITEIILKTSYLLLHEVKLEEEHVSDHYQIIDETKKRFFDINTFYFPWFLPSSCSLYCILKIIKRDKTSEDLQMVQVT